MKKQTREALNAYYVEADSWAHDRVDALQVSRRTAWRVAFGASLIAILEAIALVVLMPLKTVEPYTLLVDRQTGFVQALRPIDAERIAPDRALTQSFLVQYVIAREGFDIDSLQENYRKVALWSSGQARANYIAAAQISNPESPLARYPRSTIVETRVKSVSPVGRDVAMVRFETRRRDAGGQLGPPSAWVAVIRYRFTGEPMSIEDRFINPLGFQVVRYQRNPEAPPPAEAPPVVVVPQVQIVPVPTAPAPTQPARPARSEPEL
ncbi:MAG TPA: VirB8/TrbF family protein [Allosphingosinicella sp.]|nr:VirB8/TrbF family protein [Allosphingosinicella sp.]